MWTLRTVVYKSESGCYSCIQRWSYWVSIVQWWERLNATLYESLFFSSLIFISSIHLPFVFGQYVWGRGKSYVDFCAYRMCHYGVPWPLVQKETVVLLKCYSVNPYVMALAHNQLNINSVECPKTLPRIGNDVLFYNIRQLVLLYFVLIIFLILQRISWRCYALGVLCNTVFCISVSLHEPRCCVIY